MSNKLSIKAMILNDYWVFLATVLPLVEFGIALIISVFGFMPDLKRGRTPLGPESLNFFIAFGVVGLVVWVVVFFWKYRRISDYFKSSAAIKGVITRRWRFRDRGRIYFTYVSGDCEYTNSVAVHFSKKVKSLEEGHAVTVLIKQGNPLKSILKDIYT